MYIDIYTQSATLLYSTAPGDFNAGEYTVNFPASLNVPGRSSFDVQTLSDNIFEDVESFKCNILRIMSDEKCSDVLSGPQDMATVNITDSTGNCVQYRHT